MKKINIISISIVIAAAAILGFAISYNPEEKNSQMLTIPSKDETITVNVNYFDGAIGFLARPSEEGNYPVVIMIHEWWGLNDNIKDMARQLATEGYVVLAVDLHNGEVATTPEKARELVSSLDNEKAVANMKAAAVYLKEQQGATKLASLGWCFGGGQSLQFALSGEQLDATVIYYGSLVTDQSRLDTIQWPVLGIFGDKDTSIPVDAVNEFDSTLDTLGIENEVYIYEGVGHAFANPSGMNYAPDQTKDAWKKTTQFLDKHLK